MVRAEAHKALERNAHDTLHLTEKSQAAFLLTSNGKHGKNCLSEVKMLTHTDLPASNMSSMLTKVSKAARRTLPLSSLESSINSGSTALFVSSVLHNKQQTRISQKSQPAARV